MHLCGGTSALRTRGAAQPPLGRRRAAAHAPTSASACVAASARAPASAAAAALRAAAPPTPATLSSSRCAFTGGAVAVTALVTHGGRGAARSSRQLRLVVRDCGIFGIYKCSGNAAPEIYEGLLMLQHRGQDSAGIVTFDESKFREHKDNGLVKDVFTKEVMKGLDGHLGLGHVRYPTAGSSSAQEAQPFFVNSPLGIYLIHNGNLTNVDELRGTLRRQTELSYQRHLRTESDSEVLLNIFADEIHRAHKGDPSLSEQELVFAAAAPTMRQLKGSYSIISLISQVGLFAFRDPYGIRPLVLGHRVTEAGAEWCLASEDCAFSPLGFVKVRDVKPGEAVLVTTRGELVTQQAVPGQLNPCIFEYIYLARPDSVLNDISVYEFQLNLGRRLAARIAEQGWDIDIVVPVPDGSRPSAIEIASALNLPYREGLVKNRYVGRTFIMPSQRMREISVRRKLNAMRTVFAGKKVLLVDDSIVRGTTMTQIVSMCRGAGAHAVYLASASPPVRYPNYYGVDMPSRREFVANGLSQEEVCRVLGADGLIYQTVEDLLAAGHEMNPSIPRFDAACFDGHYVAGDIDAAYVERMENAGRGQGRVGATPVAALPAGAATVGGAASAAVAAGL